MQKITCTKQLIDELRCGKGYNLIWFVVVVLNKEFKKSFNITCGEKQNSIISWQMIRHHGEHVTYQAFPEYQVMVVWDKML